MTSKTRPVNKFVMTSKNVSWCQKVLHDVKNTSWRQKCVFTSKARHEVRKRHDIQKCIDVQRCVMTSKTRHDVQKGASWRSKHVMTSKSALLRPKVCRDVQDASWRQKKVRHDVQNTWKSASWRPIHVMTSKMRLDVHSTSWRPKHVMTSKTRHDVKKCVIASKSASWHPKQIMTSKSVTTSKNSSWHQKKIAWRPTWPRKKSYFFIFFILTRNVLIRMLPYLTRKLI